jgi:methionyl-tRNA synthetase
MKFYLTAAIPYVNAKPHIGHAQEFVQGDVIARFRKSLGDEVFYITGSDENSLKIVQAAEKEGLTPDQLATKYGQSFQDLIKALQISIDNFQRSSAAAKANGTSYSVLMDKLNKAKVGLNRKMLSEVAARYPEAFSEIVKSAK